MTLYVCENCGESYRPTGRRQRFCSRECAFVTLECNYCGEAFEVHRGRLKGRRYCSRRCGTTATADSRRKFGADNNRFNNGISYSPTGRKLKVLSDGSHTLYSRWIMEEHLGRQLDDKQEVVHHVNGDPTDDRLENLQVVTRAEHMDIHREALLAGQGR